MSILCNGLIYSLMNYNKFLILLLPFFLFVSCTGNKRESLSETKVNIIINDGLNTSISQLLIHQKRDYSVLELLQKVAIVETHPVGDYVFVSSINDVHGERGKTAWYYKINGKSPKVLAINNKDISSGDTINWIFKEDVCSGKVDK